MLSKSIILIIFLGVLFACETKEEVIKPPNIVFILADDLGWGDLSCYGSSFYETSNLDRLALEGVQFTNGYSNSPVCSPTRASLMTGKNPVQLDITDWIPGRQNKGPRAFEMLQQEPFQLFLPSKEKTLAEMLKSSGYSTFFAGKWHLGKDSIYWPEHQGFDINKGGWGVGAPRGYKSATEGAYFVPYNNPRLEDGPKGEYITDRLTAEAIQFIKEKKDTPFLLYLSFYTVHNPLQGKLDKLEKYKKKASKLAVKAEERFRDGEEWMKPQNNWKQRIVQDNPVYASMVESMDENVGKVLDQLKELGLDENTIVVFTSDNGGLSTAEGSPTVNRHLRAGKGWLYEGGIRVPTIVRWPAKIKGGQKTDMPVMSSDFYPTILEAAGVSNNIPKDIEGESLLPFLTQKEEPSLRSMFWHYPHYSNQGGKPGTVLRKGNFKLIHFIEDDNIELYNLKEDPSESKDLSKELIALSEEMREEMQAWETKWNVKIPKTNANYISK